MREAIAEGIHYYMDHFDLAMYLIGSFAGPGLVAMLIEASRFEAMNQSIRWVLVVLGLLMWAAGVSGIYTWGSDRDE